MSVSESTLEKSIDPRVDASQSIVLRYRAAFRFDPSDEEDARFKDLLQRTSIREGARIFRLLEHRGVEIFVLDESSLMHTRTLKSVDGCVTIARCLQHGYQRVVFESGGNTGGALTAYGTRAGIETFLFLPAENLPLLNGAVMNVPRAHLISVEDPAQVKPAAHLFRTSTGYPHIPRTSWRIEASRFRGMLIGEHMAAHGPFDWLVQTISAGFGPIGIYWTLRRLGSAIGGLPRFLGVQQVANCPVYRAWKKQEPPAVPTVVNSTTDLLSQVMYDSHPQTYGTYDDLVEVLDSTRGDLVTLDRRQFDRHVGSDCGARVLERLRESGIEIRVDIERTGLMALVGALEAIEAATIPEGSRILVCLTSGMSDADGQARPEYTVPSLAHLVRDYGQKWMER